IASLTSISFLNASWFCESVFILLSFIFDSEIIPEGIYFFLPFKYYCSECETNSETRFQTGSYCSKCDFWE
ncbi:hypothetical protein, partial [uncultured Sulfurimonas sp.]|uniref:hypothetical protein n=1 Tax=uncultured Sulfurimonas sp. TaxID=291845 RepID=UPI0032B2C551